MRAIREAGGGRAHVIRFGVLAFAVAASVGGKCQGKPADFFSGFDNGFIDDTPPFITGFEPASGAILNDDEICVTVEDIAVDTGTPGSGVASVTARTAAGVTIPVVPGPVPGTFIGDISGLGDGPHTVEWTARDQAGNESTATQSFTKDQTPPAVSFSQQPSPMGSSNAASFDFRFAGTIMESNLGPSMFEVRRRQGAECASTDPLWPQGTEPGQVSANMVPITSGAFDFTITAFNGVPTGGNPTTAQYCLNTVLADVGVDKKGTATPNTTLDLFGFDLTWQPAPQSLTADDLSGNWAWSRMRTQATGNCTSPIPTSGTGSISNSGNQLTVRGLHPNMDLTGPYDPVGQMSTTQGSVVFSNGFRLDAERTGTYSRESGGQIQMMGQMIVRHFSPNSSSPDCTETYAVTGAGN